MRTSFAFISSLLFLFAAGLGADTFAATKSQPGVAVTGKRFRKNVRHLRLASLYEGDMRAVYAEFGYTPHRLRFYMAARQTEQWTYYDKGLRFVFDEDGNLIDRCEIPADEGLRSFPGRSP